MLLTRYEWKMGMKSVGLFEAQNVLCNDIQLAEYFTMLEKQIPVPSRRVIKEIWGKNTKSYFLPKGVKRTIKMISKIADYVHTNIMGTSLKKEEIVIDETDSRIIYKDEFQIIINMDQEK